MLSPPWSDIHKNLNNFFDTTSTPLPLPLPLQQPSSLTCGQDLSLTEHFLKTSTIGSISPFRFYLKAAILERRANATRLVKVPQTGMEDILVAFREDHMISEGKVCITMVVVKPTEIPSLSLFT
jgi:hypothetical protein